MVRRIGILTGGGDCPGLNAVIRAAVRRADTAHNIDVIGFRNGFAGVIEGTATPLTRESTRGILHLGGTMLGTSRVDPIAAKGGGVDRIREVLEMHELDGLLVIGGEGTLSAATALSGAGLHVVGVPKTIDNDVDGTQFTIGFSTALEIATEAVDRLHSTAESHNRIMLLEVMGRHTGWIATYAGLAGGADAILIPEHPFDIDRVARHLKRRHATGRLFSIVVVAEGAVPEAGTITLPEPESDEFGRPRLGGIASFLGPMIEERTGFSTRVTILGHVQRGGSPNSFDRVLGTSMGVAAVDAMASGNWGTMVGMHGNAVVPVRLAEATATLKTVPRAMYDVAEVFFG
ncbi:MAG: ATP-dependent 6-phosphofructokinase [Nitriliruptorales bacterium]|nr:ATP-dependent 6-phosphofructokinase [Nitriliruptorales bacterium]